MPKDIRINREIRASQVRLIGVDGKQQGVMPFEEALKIAQVSELDLVEVASDGAPPVCRVMNFGKYQYEQKRRFKEGKKKQHIVHMKEVKMRPAIGEHDYQFKRRNIERFLQAGDKVKVFMTFRGREIVHQKLGQEILQQLTNDLCKAGVVEVPAKKEGGSIVVSFAPNKKAGE